MFPHSCSQEIDPDEEGRDNEPGQPSEFPGEKPACKAPPDFDKMEAAQKAAAQAEATPETTQAEATPEATQAEAQPATEAEAQPAAKAEQPAAKPKGKGQPTAQGATVEVKPKPPAVPVVQPPPPKVAGSRGIQFVLLSLNESNARM